MELKEIYPDVIWSVQYTGDEKNIFAIRMYQWRDAEYLENFIFRHKRFIENNPFWDNHSVQDIIVSAKREAKNLLKYINRLYTNTLHGLHPDFSDKFYILERPPYTEEKEARRKLYGRAEDDNGYNDFISSVFRFYAIKVNSEKEDESPAYIITGGGIKLTAKMLNMKELNQEYNKMLSVQDWLSKQGIKTKESLYALKNGKNE